VNTKKADEMRKVIAIIGTLDTKEAEARYLKNEIEKFRHDSLLIDVSLRKHIRSVKDAGITNEEIAKAAGYSIDAVAHMEKGKAIEVMIAGGSSIVSTLWRAGKLNAVIGYGGRDRKSVV
jgi:uncharacterized protein (UPF0261 family)